MKRDTVAKLPGLFQRGTVWWLRVMVPLDLQPAYGRRKKLVQSLDTSDWREASTKGTKLRADKLAEFEDMRRALNPQPVAHLTPELGATLGERLRSRLLQWDDDLRSDPKRAQLWLAFTDAVNWKAARALQINPGRGSSAAPLPSDEDLAELARQSPFGGLTPRQLRRFAEVNRGTDEVAALRLASRNLSDVVPMADSEARKLGLVVDWKAPEARPILMDCLRAYRAAHADIVKRDEGHDVLTPALPAKAPAAAPVYLRDVYARWKDVKKRSPDTLLACERALALFEQQSGNTPVQQITRGQGDEFRAWLQTLGTSSKTAHDRITWVKSLLRYAFRDLELIQRQPWDGIDVKHRTEKPRGVWTEDEMNAFFSLPLFNAYELPKDPKAGADAAYWIPILGLFTGARVGELGQLRVADVLASSAGTSLRITDEAEGATVKSDAGHREVPLHSELIRLGFLDYVAAIKKSGADSLWPAMRFRKGKPGAYFSDWVNPFHKTATKNKGAPVFHELRHSARTALTEAGVDASIKDRITGHAIKGSTGTRVYEHPTEVVRRSVELIRYRGVKLKRIYRP